MADAFEDWTVLEHGPLEPLSENLWRVWGALPRMSLRRTMTVARRADGSLVVHNGIALGEPTLRELDALGPVRAIVVPNGYHRLDAPAFAKRYPEARVFAPRGSRTLVASVVRVDGTYEDFPSDDVVRLEPLPGVADAEGAMLVRSRDGLTLVLNDIVFNMDRKKDPLGFLITTALGSAPGPRISRLARLAIVKDARALREALLRYGERPDLVRLVVSHEKVAHGPEAAAALRQACTYLG